jgi:hypothetical protein
MRLPGTPRECGPLWELGWISRQLGLGAPVLEGTDTIPVASIVGTVERGRDFDACWHPLNPGLAKTLADIQAASPTSLDEPIDVIRVDRAYFVTDGHKRVSLAHRTGREFIDAHVSHVPTPFTVTQETDEEVVFRTARELEFRRHSGMLGTFPEVRFALTEIGGYGELFHSVQAHAFELSEAAGQIVPRDEVARDWYANDYLPTVTRARSGVGELIDGCTDADVYLAVHRRRVAWWGTECDDVDCAAHEEMVQERLASARGRGLLGGFLRGARSAHAARVLPSLAEDH